MDFSFFHRFWGNVFGSDEAPVEGKNIKTVFIHSQAAWSVKEGFKLMLA